MGVVFLTSSRVPFEFTTSEMTVLAVVGPLLKNLELISYDAIRLTLIENAQSFVGRENVGVFMHYNTLSLALLVSRFASALYVF